MWFLSLQDCVGLGLLYFQGGTQVSLLARHAVCAGYGLVVDSSLVLLNVAAARNGRDDNGAMARR